MQICDVCIAFNGDSNGPISHYMPTVNNSFTAHVYGHNGYIGAHKWLLLSPRHLACPSNSAQVHLIFPDMSRVTALQRPAGGDAHGDIGGNRFACQSDDAIDGLIA